MNQARRQILIGLGAGLASYAGLARYGGTQSQVVPAEQSPSVPGRVVFSGAFVEDIRIFSRLRRSSRILLHLRRMYRGPYGYEDREWEAGAFDAWRRAYGDQLCDGRDSSRARFSRLSRSDIDRILADIGHIRGLINQRLADRRPIYGRWLAEIGVEPNGQLSLDMINGQIGMAVLLLASDRTQQASRSLQAFDERSWVFPICGPLDR